MTVISGDEKLDLYQALTRYNYFPNQKGSILENNGEGELPPCISTRQFTPYICEALAKSDGFNKESCYGRKGGYDVVEYKATRFNNMPRTLSLIHPKAYSLLAKHIHDHWENLKHIQESECSQIVPKQSHDGRIMVMSYGESVSKQEPFQNSFAMRFKVSADIANCFNSIYSHAIPWAIVGLYEAKNHSENKKLWYNQLDNYQRKSKRNETQGIPIGPATSNIIVELILQQVDKRLAEKKFKFKRYIDDYECFCPSYENAQEFILCLGQELSVYKLSLNLYKTHITELPCTSQDDWVIELLEALPNRFGKPEGIEQKFNSAEIVRFINKAIKLNKASPDGSVLKYAVRLIVGDVDYVGALALLDILINLAWHYPTLIPFIATLLNQLSEADTIEIPKIHFDHLNQIIIENAKQLRSDGMSWPLHILRSHSMHPSSEAIEAVIQSKDCISITILYSILENKQRIIDFVNEEVLKGDDYKKDNYWLLLYQLFYFGDLEEGYCNDKVFTILKEYYVNFIPDETITKSENEWETVLNKAMFSDRLLQFEEAAPIYPPEKQP